MSMTKRQLIQQLTNDPTPDTAQIFMHDGQNSWEINELTHQGVADVGAGRKGGEAGSASTPQLYLRVKRTADVGSQVGSSAKQSTPTGR